MKKSLIALAVAGAFAAPVAHAEVTLSGAIAMGVQYVNVGSGKTAGGADVGSYSTEAIGAGYSHIDLDSADDIGGGNKVLFHFQMQVNPMQSSFNGAGGGGPFNRDSYIGAGGTWGSIKFGTNENAYERMLYEADPMDGAWQMGGNLQILGTPGANTVFDIGQDSCGASGGFAAGTTGGCAGFYRRTDQTIWYNSPDFNGFTFEADYTLPAFKALPGGNGMNPQVFSIAGRYKPQDMPFQAWVGYEEHKDMFGINLINANLPGGGAGFATTGSKDQAFQVGGGYTFGDLLLTAIVERLEYKADNGALTDYKRNAEWLGAKYNVPTGYIGAEAGIAQSASCEGTLACGGTGAKMLSAGYWHNLSKQSQLFVIGDYVKNDDNATYAQAAQVGVAALGSKIFGATVGLKHTF